MSVAARATFDGRTRPLVIIVDDHDGSVRIPTKPDTYSNLKPDTPPI
jgi:hypothetical protein